MKINIARKVSNNDKMAQSIARARGVTMEAVRNDANEVVRKHNKRERQRRARGGGRDS